MLRLLAYRYRKRNRVSIIGLFHTGVAVADLDYSLWFYRDLLGFEVIRDRSLGGGERVVFLSIPGTTVQFELFHTPATGGEPASAPFGRVGSGHFCLYVEDVRAFLKQLARDYPAAANADLRTIESGAYAGATVAVLADPSGYHIELFDQAGASGK
jgi:catechol 2,3-dioxygenase-like lactoylglutathione lyase family enzyme